MCAAELAKCGLDGTGTVLSEQMIVLSVWKAVSRALIGKYENN
jgi:hypothetical protein